MGTGRNGTISCMPTIEEKTAFAERLKFAMNRAPEKLRGGTDLALHFNLRHRGAQPVSPQTVHKWLSARTIPTNDKLQTLAEWFKVDLHWLHYGPAPVESSRAVPGPLPPASATGLSAEALELSAKIEALKPHHRYLIHELVAQFYGDACNRLSVKSPPPPPGDSR